MDFEFSISCHMAKMLGKLIVSKKCGGGEPNLLCAAHQKRFPLNPQHVPTAKRIVLLLPQNALTRKLNRNCNTLWEFA